MSEHDEFFHYLPVGDLTLKWGTYVTGAGRSMIYSGGSYPLQPHPTLYQFDWSRGRILPEFALLLITDGEGEFDSEATGPCRIQGDTVLILFPGHWHRYRPDPNIGWTERWISFNGELVHRFFSLGTVKPEHMPISLQDSNHLKNHFDKILDHIDANPNQNSLHLSMESMSLTVEAIESLSIEPSSLESSFVDGPPDQDDEVVHEALLHIWTRSHKPLSVEDVARALSVPRRTLDRRFAASRGRSVLEEINLCRTSRAKRLLIETNLPVKFVAFLAGFTSSERMRVTFVETENVSPSEYRKRSSSAPPFNP